MSRNEASGLTTITNKGGTISTISGGAAQAVALPAYAPRYPGSTVVAVINTANQKGHAQDIRMDTSAPATAVMPFYRRALTSNGGKVDVDMGLPNGGGMLTGKANGRKVSITVDPEDGKTAIVVSIDEDGI